MRTLLVLRHAKSSWAVPGQTDFERPLSERGDAQLVRLRSFLQAEGIRAERVLCSPAARTRATLDGILSALGEPPVAYDDTLYNGTVDGYRAALSACTDNHLLLVGHNPTCDELVRHLAAPSSPAANALQAGHFATGTLARLIFEGDDWADLRRGSGRLDLFVTPKALAEA